MPSWPRDVRNRYAFLSAGGADSGGGDVRVQRFGERVMAWHHVLLAAFLVQPDQPARALRLEIFDTHLQRRADAGEAVGEGGDERAIAQVADRISRDGVDQPPPLVALQYRGVARLDDAHRGG